MGKKPAVVAQGKQNMSTDSKNPIHSHRETHRSSFRVTLDGFSPFVPGRDGGRGSQERREDPLLRSRSHEKREVTNPQCFSPSSLFYKK